MSKELDNAMIDINWDVRATLERLERAVSDRGYQRGYEEGHKDGWRQGYDEGHDLKAAGYYNQGYEDGRKGREKDV